MKKYMIAATAFLLVASMANAQMATKETAKNITPKPSMTSKTSTSTPHKAATVATSSGTPSASVQKTTTVSTAIKRKHPAKKANSLKKTVNK